MASDAENESQRLQLEQGGPLQVDHVAAGHAGEAYPAGGTGAGGGRLGLSARVRGLDRGVGRAGGGLQVGRRRCRAPSPKSGAPLAGGVPAAAVLARASTAATPAGGRLGCPGRGLRSHAALTPPVTPCGPRSGGGEQGVTGSVCLVPLRRDDQSVVPRAVAHGRDSGRRGLDRARAAVAARASAWGRAPTGSRRPPRPSAAGVRPRAQGCRRASSGYRTTGRRAAGAARGRGAPRCTARRAGWRTQTGRRGWPAARRAGARGAPAVTARGSKAPRWGEPWASGETGGPPADSTSDHRKGGSDGRKVGLGACSGCSSWGPCTSIGSTGASTAGAGRRIGRISSNITPGNSALTMASTASRAAWPSVDRAAGAGGGGDRLREGVGGAELGAGSSSAALPRPD